MKLGKTQQVDNTQTWSFQSCLDLIVERPTYELLRNCAKGRYAPRQANLVVWDVENCNVCFLARVFFKLTALGI